MSDRDRDFSERHGHSARALFRPNGSRDPLERRGTSGIEPHPLWFGIINPNRNKHSTGADSEWQTFHYPVSGRFSQNPYHLVLVIKLDDSVVEEIGANNAIHRSVSTGLAQVAQVQSQVITR